MQTKIDATIHNRYDVFRTNIETGVTEQIAYAENIVLDYMYQRLCNGYEFFKDIAYGTGTGTLDPARTTLFAAKGYKTASFDERSRSFPTSWVRKYIVLNPAEEVGTVITEVGICWQHYHSPLVSHAMLRDMNGNPLSITKTALDVLTIYATVFSTYSTGDANIALVRPSNNYLVAYLTAEMTSISSVYLEVGTNQKEVAFPFSQTLSANLYQGIVSPGADVPNKKLLLLNKRIEVGQGNGHIAEIGYNNICRLHLPATGIYTGLEIAGATVGAGDGLKSVFLLPSKNVNAAGIVVKIDALETTAFTSARKNRSYNSKELIDYQSAHSGYLAGVSQNGIVSGCSWTSNAPLIAAYDSAQGVWIRRATIPYAGATMYGIAFSNDGAVLAVSWLKAGYYLRVYDWSGSAWIERPAPTPAPTTSGKCWLSSNGNIVAEKQDGSPYLNVYDWSGTAWSKRAAPTGISGYCQDFYLTPDGNVLVTVTDSSPFMRVYDWSGSAWVIRTAPASLPSSYPNGCSISNDGLSVALCLAGTTTNMVYDWTGGAWVQRGTIPATSGSPSNICISADGNTVIVATQTAPYVFAFYWQENTWKAYTGSLYPNIPASPRIAYVQDTVLVCAHAGGEALWMYDMHPLDTEITFTTPPGLVTGEAVGTGDGVNDTFVLDHVPITGSLVMYLDAVETSAYVETDGTIVFTAPPGNGVAVTSNYRYTCAITADYTVDGIHKTPQRVIDISGEITFGEVV